MKTKTLAIILTAILCATMFLCTTGIVNSLNSLSNSIPSKLNVSANYPSYSTETPDEIVDCFFEIKKTDKENKSVTIYLGFSLKEAFTDSTAVFRYGKNYKTLTYNNGIFEGNFVVKQTQLPCEKLMLQITEGTKVRNINLTISDTVNSNGEILNFFSYESFFEPKVEHSLNYIITDQSNTQDTIGIAGTYRIMNDYYQSVKDARIAIIIDGKERTEDSINLDIDTAYGFIEHESSIYEDYYSFTVANDTEFTMALIISLKDGTELTYDIPLEQVTEYPVEETEVVALF